MDQLDGGADSDTLRGGTGRDDVFGADAGMALSDLSDEDLLDITSSDPSENP